MNFIEISQQIMKGEKIDHIPLRVVYYARVSTDSEKQLNSLDNQLNYYEKFIKTKANWSFIRGYIDEGISGVSVKNRIAFQQMIADAKLHKFDLIITKEVSRFARDLEDSIHYIRLLKEANVGVYFENQNIHTFDSNSELILNIMFNLAQEESRKLSSRIKFGHHQAIHNGHVLGSSNIIGYKKDKCKLIIDDKESQVIKKIFALYASGAYGFYKLAKKLGEYGYYNSHGHYYDKETLKRIIENPKYKGYYRGKTTEVIDYRSKKRVLNPIDKQVIYKTNEGIVPAIVSEKLWNQANEVLKQRTGEYQKNNFSGGLKYPFSSKIICQNDGCHFQRTIGRKSRNRPTWSCSQYLKYRKDACSSPIIVEQDLYLIFDDVIKYFLPNKNKITDDLLKIYHSMDTYHDLNTNINQIDTMITKLENQKNILLDLIFSKQISKNFLINQFNKLDSDILELKNKKDNMNCHTTSIHHFQEVEESIRNEINTNIVNIFIREYVSKIMVSKINKCQGHTKLDIYLNIDHNQPNKITLKNQVLETKKKGNINTYVYDVYI